VCERVHAALQQENFGSHGKELTPRLAIIDSQRAKTTEAGCPKGYDGGRKLGGRKRHLLVDTLGLSAAVYRFVTDGTTEYQPNLTGVVQVTDLETVMQSERGTGPGK
jgi:hypothetical protein